MQELAFSSNGEGHQPAGAPWGKPVADLTDLVQALTKALPNSKPWQRQLHAHLAEVDRRIQILRLLHSLRRDDTELEVAVADIQKALRVANAYAASGRVDMVTKMAIRLALDLGGKLAA